MIVEEVIAGKLHMVCLGSVTFHLYVETLSAIESIIWSPYFEILSIRNTLLLCSQSVLRRRKYLG